ncbi:MAG: hypothetical protein FH756_00125 [Firmicutes bacterium]|nr:hypothetical protein [Bacillota bacterium]
MELIDKGVNTNGTQTFEVDDVRIKNVIVPKNENIRLKYKMAAKKVLKKCGIRPKVSYYPIPPEVAKKKEMVPFYFLCLARCREEKKAGRDNSVKVRTIKELAGDYRTSPDRREQILRHINNVSGKEGLQSFVKILGSDSVTPFIKWVKNDIKDKNRSRRHKKRSPVNPPAPPRETDYGVEDVFQELEWSSQTNTGSRLGKQGGKRSIHSGQAWSAISRV